VAVILEIADAVADLIGVSFPYTSMDVKRRPVPVHRLFDLDGLHITVVPAELSLVALSRRDHDFTYAVDVGVQQRIPEDLDEDDSDAFCDDLMTFAEDLVDLFRGKRLVGYEDARCVEIGNAPVFDPAHRDEMRVFTSVVRLAFRVARADA
jgi:hypothetical protein